ncbi:MAG: phage protease, partial [Desulfovibrionaceae bacterium]
LPGGEPPSWVGLIPRGPKVAGRDGRWWICGDAEVAAICSRFAADGVPLPIDWEHATEVAAPTGREAPAAGWVTQLEVREGALWGQVDWTPRARQQIAGREYRFLSPVFSFTKTDRRIQALHSAGLTNAPNLRLTALNRRALNQEEDAMKKALCRKLGLPETATEQEIEQAVAGLQESMEKAKNQAMPPGLAAALGLSEDAAPEQILAAAKVVEKAHNRPEVSPEVISLDRYVPRADYDRAMNRVKEAEDKLAKVAAEALEEEIDRAVNTAVAEGKIAPASTDFYKEMCRTEGGLDKFKTFAESAPQVIKDPKLPASPEDKPGKLDDSQLAICRAMGLDPEEYAKSLKEDA